MGAGGLRILADAVDQRVEDRVGQILDDGCLNGRLYGRI